MKRKLFSAVLFGAILAASTSSLSSCKDYDDDIQNLQGQIDKMATADQLSAKAAEMQSAIAAAQAAAESKAAAAETVAKAAKESAAAAATAAEKAGTGSDEATKAAAAVQAVADAAQKAVNDLEAKAATKDELAAAQQAVSDIIAKIQKDHATDKAAIEKSIETAKNDLLAKIDANTKALDALKKRLDAVEAKLSAGEGGEEIDLSAIKSELDDIDTQLKSIIGAYSTMITSINIFKISNGNIENTSWGGSSAEVYRVKTWNPTTGTWERTDYSWPYATYYFNSHAHQVTSDFVQNYDGKLNFYQVVERANEFPKDGETADKFVFEEGYVRTYEDSILVRVNPVGAVLKKENISLINSQGKELNDLIEVTEVRKFDGLLTGSDYRTRAAEVENGLWVIKVKPVDNYSADEFKDAAISGNSSVLYAVSVKNDEENKNVDADRRVVSEYGLSLYNNDIYYWDNFSVSDYSDNAYDGFKQIYNIHNRYRYCETERTSTSMIPELEWKNAPDVEITEDNVVNRNGADDRQNEELVIAKVGDKIKIHNDGNIKGFYVTLDYQYAKESGKSELNAWNSYSYENVTKISRLGEIIEKGKLQEGPDGYITVKDMNDVEGDIIGFRLYAVNLDGTIVNPDGRAFYVGIGTFNSDVTLPAQTIAINTENYTNFFDVTTGSLTGNGISTDYIDVKDAFNVEYDFINELTMSSDKSGYEPRENRDYEICYWKQDNDGNYISTGKTDAEYITVKLLKPEMFEDNLNYTLTMNLKPTMSQGSSATNYTTRKVTVDVKKTMPTYVPEFSYITEQTKNQIMVPHDASHNVNYTVDLFQSKEGYKDLNNVYLFNENSLRFKDDPYFSYDIATSTWNADREKDVLKVTTPYQIHIGGEFVDNKEEHAVKSTYLYQQISRIWDAKTNSYIYGQENDHQYRVEKATNTPLVYMSWAYYNKYSWTSTYTPSVKWVPAGNATLDLDLTKLAVKNTADGGTFNKGNLSEYLTSKWLQIKAGSVRTYVGAQENPYFKPTSVTNSTITLEQKDQAQAAPANTKHTEKIEFVVYDCFLNEYTVTLDFTVTRD